MTVIQSEEKREFYLSIVKAVYPELFAGECFEWRQYVAFQHSTVVRC